MLITKGLLVKGIAASAALATASLGAVYNKKISNFIFGDKTIEKLGIPSECEVDGEECTLTEGQLKAIEFKNKDRDVTVEGTVTGLKLSIKKLEDSDKAKYGEDIKVGDLWFTFKTESITEDIKVKKGETVITSLIKGTNPEFKINSDGKLEKAWTDTTLGKKVGLTCPATAESGDSGNKCSVESGATISYKNSNSIQQLTTSSKVTDGITYEEDKEGYNQGFKFTVSANAVSGSNSSSLPAGEYEIKYEEGESKGWYLIKKGEIAQGGAGGAAGGISAQGSNSANTEINKKITETLKLPDSCKFPESGSDTLKECEISDSELKKIEFKGKGENELTVDGTVSNLKLEIKKLQDSDKARYGSEITVGDLWFTFKTESITADITIKNNGEETNQIKLVKGTNPEFKINSESKLEKAWTVTTLGEKVGLTCPASTGDGSADKKCTIEANKEISYKEGEEIKKITVSNKVSEGITYEVDTQEYNQGFKFTVSSDVSGSDNTTLSAGNYEIKYDSTNSWYFLKKTEGQAQ